MLLKMALKKKQYVSWKVFHIYLPFNKLLNWLTFKLQLVEF